jgi:hypothetical protein
LNERFLGRKRDEKLKISFNNHENGKKCCSNADERARSGSKSIIYGHDFIKNSDGRLKASIVL